jgi:hypothetical protein
MSGISGQSKQAISEDSRNVTSSLGLADGHLRSNSLGGLIRSLCGPEAVPASHSLAQESAMATPTNGISGLTFSVSSASASLQSSLENRLRQRMDVNGSLEYELTWKDWDMESGPPICALRAQARRTSDSGYGGWPSPMAGTPATDTYNEAGNNDSSRKTVSLLAGWPTASARDWKNGQSNQHGKNAWPLNEVAMLAGWTTPQTHDAQGNGSADRLMRHGTTHGCRNLQDEVHLAEGMTTLAFGPSTTSSPASTEKRGALNPEHSRWLMGFPPEWENCAPMAMPSSRKSRRNS